MKVAYKLAGAVGAIWLVLVVGWLLTQAPEALSVGAMVGLLAVVGWHAGGAIYNNKLAKAKERHPLSKIT